MFIKDILKENNIELDLPNKILNMKFKGKFIFTELFLKKYRSLEATTHELETARTLSWKFHNFETGNSIYITPYDQSFILTFRFINYINHHNPNEKNVSGAVSFDNNGNMSAIHPYMVYNELFHEI